MADGWGDLKGGADGLFDRDTRLLSRLVMTVGLARPSRLSSGVSQDNVYFTCHSTNRPLPPMGGVRRRRVNLVLLLVHLSTDAAQALVS